MNVLETITWMALGFAPTFAAPEATWKMKSKVEREYPLPEDSITRY
jgi:hypothetical protein